MKHIFLILVLSVAMVYLSEASKQEKRNSKKHRPELDHKLDNFVDEIENEEDSDVDGLGHKLNFKHKKDGKMNHHKKEKFDHRQQLSWLNINKDSDCGLQCKHGEICITGPIDTKPICVLKKDLKKSLKIFHRYQKKEMKAWKQFQKEYHSDNRLAEADNKVHEKGRTDLAEVKKNQLKEDGLGHHRDSIDRKIDLSPVPVEAGDPEECSTSQFSQMRTRLMGWFHLLHGQSHLAKKTHDGNMKHFYKHVSVKKELREHKGNKCECLKSAMWQFTQMNKDNDDHLNSDELSLLRNSLEPCMQPYLTSCDQNADDRLSSSEWCCCFSNVVAPCFKKVDEIRKSEERVTYMPRCDKEGYFMREQCSGDSEKSYKCWCVDYNGNEYKGTQTNGRAHCSKISRYGEEKPQTEE